MNTPLADRVRPQELANVVGQRHLLGQGKPLRKIIESGKVPNMVFYGPSGIGKTTVASIIAKQSNLYLAKLNGTTASTADIKALVTKINTFETLNGILLYLDEIQYFNKKQQQTLLEYIENGSITLIASTTENPYFYVYNAILSRSTVFEFKPIIAKDIAPAIEKAFAFLSDEEGRLIELEPGVVDYIAMACGGDVRKAMNAVELAYITCDEGENTVTITLETAEQLTQKSALRYDKEGDEHYDVLSAYQKSMRGSDANAALHYLARLLTAGDLASACRRLMVCACEDVGLAWPQIIPIVKAAVDAAMMVGLPEAQMPLSSAVVLVCEAPKSNSAPAALARAMADIHAGNFGNIPRQLQNKHYDGDDVQKKGQFYLYPHDFEHHWIQQQYLPDPIKDQIYYIHGNNKSEQSFKTYWERIKGAKQPE